MKNENSDLVVKDHALTEGIIDMTVTQYKFILFLISKINKNDQDFRKQRVSVKDFQAFFGYSGKNVYTQVKKFEKDLISKQIVVESDSDLLTINWFSFVNYKKKEGIIEVAFNYDLSPFLLNLKKNFSKYGLHNIEKLKSFYAIRIYDLLKAYYYKKTFEKTLLFLRHMFALSEDKYQRFYDFKRRILDPSKKELDQSNADLTFEYEVIKNGRTPIAINFIIKDKGNIKKIKENKDPILNDFLNLIQEDHRTALLEKYLAEIINENFYSHDYIKNKLLYVNSKNIKKNFLGYFKKCLCKEDFQDFCFIEKKKKQEIEANKKKQEAEKQYTEEIVEKKKQKEKLFLQAKLQLMDDYCLYQKCKAEVLKKKYNKDRYEKMKKGDVNGAEKYLIQRMANYLLEVEKI